MLRVRSILPDDIRQNSKHNILIQKSTGGVSTWQTLTVTQDKTVTRKVRSFTNTCTLCYSNADVSFLAKVRQKKTWKALITGTRCRSDLPTAGHDGTAARLVPSLLLITRSCLANILVFKTVCESQKQKHMCLAEFFPRKNSSLCT